MPAGARCLASLGRSWLVLAMPRAKTMVQCARLASLARRGDDVGDLKSARNAADRCRGDDVLTRQIGGRPLWLAASTHPGEDEIAAAVHCRLAAMHPGLLTIVAPRHPVRGRRHRGDGRGARAAGCPPLTGEAVTADIDLLSRRYVGRARDALSVAGSPLSVALWSRSAGTTRSRRRARLRHPARAHTANCVAMVEALLTAEAAEIVSAEDALAAGVAAARRPGAAGEAAQRMPPRRCRRTRRSTRLWSGWRLGSTR